MPTVNDPQYRAELVLFSRQLRQIRRLAGDPTQEELARQMGVAKSTVCRILKGHTLPRWAVLAELLRACGLEDLTEAKAQWISIREMVEPVDQFDLDEIVPDVKRTTRHPA